MIIQADEPNKLDEILRLIWELPSEDHEVLWQWFDSKALVGGVIVDLPKEKEISKPNKEDKMFCITSVCRADLEEHFSQKEIESLTDEDMERIASKMADIYIENNFWIDLEIMVTSVLFDRTLKVGDNK